MKARLRQRGYALLVTLVMLALLGVVLGGMARRSADTALEARGAEAAMRQRWAVLSCQQTLLAEAPQRFDTRTAAWLNTAAEEGTEVTGTERSPSSETLAFELHGLFLRIRIDNEQAKLNLNQRLNTSPQARLTPRAVINEVLAPVSAARPAITRPEFVDALGFSPIESWAQVLPGQSPKELLGIPGAEHLAERSRTQDAVADRVTLWGDGRINLYAATDDTLRRRLDGLVEPATLETLLRLRRDEPALGMRGLIENAAADQPGDRAALSSALTDRSRCAAMWLACRPTAPQDSATQWSLTILESAGASSGANGGAAPGSVVHYCRW